MAVRQRPDNRETIAGKRLTGLKPMFDGFDDIGRQMGNVGNSAVLDFSSFAIGIANEVVCVDLSVALTLSSGYVNGTYV